MSKVAGFDLHKAINDFEKLTIFGLFETGFHCIDRLLFREYLFLFSTTISEKQHIPNKKETYTVHLVNI